MSDLPEDLTAAIQVLHDSGVQPAPKLKEGEEEDKRERRSREQNNAENAAHSTLLTHAFSLATRIAGALEKLAEPPTIVATAEISAPLDEAAIRKIVDETVRAHAAGHPSR